MKVKETIYSKYIKRGLDVFFSLLILILFFWLYLIVGILVLKNMGWPPIFTHRRPGKIDPKTGKEKIFKLYKFRSMTNEVDEQGVLLPNSVRLTPFGRKLRSTSLDEIPEIWNILKGDMSFVGPRPLHERNLDYYTEEEHKRHLVRPGLTGLAQVKGRTAISWDERFAYDLKYVQKITFFGDLKIIFLTAKQVLGHKNIVEAGKQGNFFDYREKQWEDGVVPRPAVQTETEQNKDNA